MKISIVIPYYENSEESKERMEYLIEILKSQMGRNKRLIVVDDGSNARWLDGYRSKWIEIIHEVHRGVSRARNVGIERSKEMGVEYVGFIDADDSVSRDYVEEGYRECKKGVYDIIDSRLIQSGIEVFGTKEGEKILRGIVRNGVAGVFYKMEIIGDKRFREDMQNGEDSDFAKRVVDIDIHRKGISKGMYVYNYGVNPNSIIMKSKRGEDLWR